MFYSPFLKGLFIMSNSGHLTHFAKCPSSDSSFKVNLFAIIIAMFNLFIFKYRGEKNIEFVTQVTIFTYASIVTVYDLFIAKSYLAASSGLQFYTSRKRDLSRILIRTVGMLGSLLFIGLLYWIFTEYHGSFYERFWNLLFKILPFFVILMPTYFIWIDAYQKDEGDIYYQVGQFLLFRPTSVPLLKIRNHFLGWIIKGFFFPLMYIFANNEVSFLLNVNLKFNSFVNFFDFMWHLIFGIDVMVVAISYVFTFRILDTHLRSPQPAALGWIIALICYQPFWSVIGTQYLTYSTDGQTWDTWLNDYETIKIIWGITILTLIGIYSLSTLAFGLRFSNLTNRGIITGGPYRWTKHPAYIAKNISWWMVSVPFIAQQSSILALKNCLGLLMLNGVYYLRAKTEEKHLAEEPAYCEYSKYIANHGIFAKLKNYMNLK